MDKNKLIGLVLISLILVVYSYFEGKQYRPIQTSSNTNSQESATITTPALAGEPTAHLPGGIFVSAAQGTAQEVVLENEDIRIILTSQGACVREVVLKKYLDYLGRPLKLLDGESSKMGFQFSSHQNPIHTSHLFFNISDEDKQYIQADGAVKQVTFVLPIGPHQSIRQKFSLADKGYTLIQEWDFAGVEGYIDQGKVEFIWDDLIRRAEKDIKACRNKTTINYYLSNQTFEYLKEHTDKKEEKKITDPIQWVSFKQRFFTAGILAEQPFTSGEVELKPTTQPDKVVKEAHMKLQLASTQQTPQGVFKFYFGPNTYQDLKAFAPGFSKNLPLGWPVVKWINQYTIIPIFAFIEKHVSNYGVVILLLVLLIKLLLLPLSYKSYISMAEMKILKPTLDALKEKYGSDMQRIQMEQVKLYKEMGINPLSGCVPVLLQMPILLAMFNFFPNAIELRQKPFLWASDLSTYDAIIHLPFHIPLYGNHVSLFTLLMTASTILYTWSNNQVNAPQGPMKTMSYLFPITFMLILNSFPAGLSFYYFVSNLITFAQQAIIKRFVDEEKIKEKLAKNKNKIDGKEKTFKQRLQESMKVATGRKKQ
jgi:YidC/Oxa1 family membrane protein insertase